MHSTSNLEDSYGSGKRLWLSIQKHSGENYLTEIREYFTDRINIRERTKETGDLISKSKKGKTMSKKNAQFGTVWNKKVKKEELETYIKDGWNRGSKRKFFKSDRKY